MSTIFNPKFWLAVRPGELSPEIFRLLALTVIGLVGLTVVFAIVKNAAKNNHYNRFLNSLYVLFLTNAIFGILIMFFNYELIPFLSSRFWFLIWAAGDITWIVFIIKKLFAVSERKLELEKEKEYKKYIPSKSK